MLNTRLLTIAASACFTSLTPQAHATQPTSPRAISLAAAVSDTEVATAVDRFWRFGTERAHELSTTRKRKPGRVDSCVKELEGKNSFGDRIGFFVREHLDGRTVAHTPIRGAGGDGENTVSQTLRLQENPIPVGLITHPMCKHTASSMFHGLSSLSSRRGTDAKKFVADFEASRPRPTTAGAHSHKLADLMLGAESDFIAMDVHHALFSKRISIPESPAQALELRKLFAGYRKLVAQARAGDKVPLQKFLRETPLERLARAANTTMNHAPDARTTALANRFGDDHNSLRKKALAGDMDARKKFGALYGRLMGCIAYAESLDEPDTERAKKLADADYPKNENGEPGKILGDGVEYYMDLSPDGGKQLTIGLYQFNPGAFVNQFPCVESWNRTHPSCTIEIDNTNRKMSSENLLRAIASPLQTYNAFCGVNKIVQSFHTQANTMDPARTHPLNRKDGSDKFKAAADRCVSLHFRASMSFNHFGPLQNSTDTNLNRVLACVYGES